MANNINLIVKYFPEAIDKFFAEKSKTAILVDDKKWVKLDFKNAGWVKVASILLDGLSNYRRVNHVGQAGAQYADYNGNNGANARDGYPIGSAAITWEEFRLQYDRAIQLKIDYADDEESQGILIGNAAEELTRKKLIPEADTVRFSTIAGKTRLSLGNRLENQTIAPNTILGEFQKGFQFLTEHEVAEEDQVIFISPDVETLLTNSTELTKFITQEDFRSDRGVTFKLNAYKGRPIITVPSDRFYTEVECGENGYYPTANSKVINFLIVSKRAVSPIVKLNIIRLFGPEVVQDFDGYKLNARFYHDCIIPRNKVPGIYANISGVSASTRTSKLDVILSTGVTTNGYVLDEYYTVPSGIAVGRVVTAQTAFTLGTTVTVDGSTIKYVPEGAETIETNDSAYFALVDSYGNVVATSSLVSLTGIKKA